VGLALTLIASACSHGSAKHRAAKVKSGSCPAGTMTGAGSTVLDTLVQRWIKDYRTRCKDASVTYQPVGTQAGIQQLSAGTVTFAATDAALTADQEQAAGAKGGQVLHVPWAGDGVAIAYHLSGVKSLNLSAATLAGIFSGAITQWNDPKFQADNDGVTLPATPVHVVYRSDDNPGTATLSGYLASSAPSQWSAGIGSHLVHWPTGQATDSPGAMTDVLANADGTIGYTDAAAPAAAGVTVAGLKNPAGKFVTPEPAAMTAALAEAPAPADLKIVANYAPTSPAAYPMTFPTWAVMFAKLPDAGQVDLLKDFLHYALDAGQATAASLHYAALPDALRDKARVAVDGIAPTTGPTTSSTAVGVVNPLAAPTTTAPGASKGGAAPGGGGQIFPIPPGGNGGTTAVGVSGGGISVGNVSTLGGPQPGLMAGAVAGTAAFFAYQNSLGGVYGRGLNVVSIDDGFDPGRNQSGYAGLVGKVFGFVGSSSAVDDGGAQVLSQHPEIPDVSEAESRARFSVPNNFSVAPFAPGWPLGPLNYYKAKFGSTVVQHMAIFAVDNQAAKDAMAGEQAAAQSIGYQFVYSRIIEPTESPSGFQMDVVNMKQHGVQGIMMLTDVTQMATMASLMQQQGFHPPLANWGPAAYDPAFLNGHTDGATLAQPLALFGGEDSGNPEVQLFLHWLKQVAPNQRPDIFAAYGWESARLFVQALGAAGPRPTQDAVMAQLKATDNFDGNGMLAPAGPASKRPPTCFVTMTISNNGFVRADPPSGFICDQGGYFHKP
jgi:phosphate transport system substrate-binding protein